jgi:hypothetical protein
VALERLGDHGERHVLLELGRPPRQDRQTAFGAARERLGDQRGLPDAGFAPDDGDGALASANPVEQIVDRLKLGIAPDEPRLRGWVVELGDPLNCKPGTAASFSAHVRETGRDRCWIGSRY